MRKRSIRFRGRRKKSQVFDIDITSLLDILVILLVFLLKSYNTTGVIINIPEGVTIPTSKSQSVNSEGIMIQVSPTTVWVDDKKIIDEGSDRSKVFDNTRHGKKLIIPLYNELVKKRETIKQVKTLSTQAKSFSGIANLVVDKTIKYSFIKKIMYTCAEAGFKKYKFVVMGEE